MALNLFSLLNYQIHTYTYTYHFSGKHFNLDKSDIENPLYNFIMRGKQEAAKTRKFIFPVSRLDFQNISGVQEVRNRLKAHENAFDKFKISDIYNITEAKVDNKHQIMAVCKYCKTIPSKLIWSKRMDMIENYKLKKFKQQHEHTVLKREIHKQILAMMSNYYNKLPISEIEKYCLQKFDINGQEFKLIKQYMIKKMFQKTFIDDIEEFRKLNYLTMYPEKLKIDLQTGSVTQFPHFLFTTSKKMIRRFEHYGRVLFLHRFPFLIKKNSNSEYYVLVASGLNEYANIIFFGFSIVNAMSPEFICQTLVHLFKCATRSICETIFTQNQACFNEGIDAFGKKTNIKLAHLYDLLLQIKQPDREKKQQFKKALMSATNKQFATTISEYQKLRPDESLKIEVFRKKSPRYCLSQIPEVFVGLGPPVTHCADILNTIIKLFPKQIDYNRFVFKFSHFLSLKEIARYPSKMVEDTEMPLLSDCLNVIATEPFNYILSNLLTAMQININGILENNQMKIRDNVHNEDYTVFIEEKKRDYEQQSMVSGVSKFFQRQTLSYDEIQLNCSCLFKNKTGIPCVHIMRVCMHMQIPLSSQVDSFWKSQNFVEAEEQLGQLKISNKNGRNQQMQIQEMYDD